MTWGSEEVLIETSDLKDKDIVRPAFALFENELLVKWAGDLEPFINEGRVLYVPDRLLLRLEIDPKDGSRNWRGLSIDENSPWSLWKVITEAENERITALVATSDETIPQQGYIELLNASLPFIDGISFKMLHQVMNDEEDSLANFRREISKTFPTYLALATNIDDPIKLNSLAVQIRRDVVEPEIAKLNRSFKKIIQTRSIRVAGGCLATIGLAGIALAAHGLQNYITGISGILGTGGLGVVTKEYADYQLDRLNLKDDPWYFAWRMKEIAK